MDKDKPDTEDFPDVIALAYGCTPINENPELELALKKLAKIRDLISNRTGTNYIRVEPIEAILNAYWL